MIYTVTFNPALDYVVFLDNLKLGDVNRSTRESIFYGGKGINVSTILNTLGLETTALGFVAGFTGKAIEDGLAAQGIHTDFIHLPEGNSRINVKVKHGDETEINGQGPVITEEAINELFAKLDTLTKEDHIRDAELIEEIGANTVRLAHYQHAQEFYNECDKRGFVVWAEIPFISVMNEDPLAHENCITQLKELIYQNDHHPSSCFWGISNEILIGGISEKLVENHRELNALAKKIDPYRLTTIAHVTMTPKDGPMHEITDVESYNHYFGWYGGKTEDNGPWMDEYHEKYPNRCIGLSEYGCEGIITYQGGNPKCKDYSEAYQAGYHEYMAHMLERRPWIFCSYVWNMFDFGCAARSEGGVTGRNNKGLVTMDRKIKKDSFYLYKAYWNPEPMVHICDKRYSLRSGENTQIRVYTNQERVTLFVNGEEMAVNEVKRHVASFPISLSGGKNAILVKAGDVWDAVTIDRVEKEPESYVFPEASEREEGVANWFQEVGSLNLSEEMKYPEDRYHIRCTLEEISENDEAMELVTKAMKLITGMTLAKEEGMWDMMKKMKLESMKEMLGAMAPDGFLESLNMKLNEIKKENLNG